MTHDYWETRLNDLKAEYKGRYLSEPYLFNEALAENEQGQLTLVRTILLARERGFNVCSVKSIERAMELIAEEHAETVAKAMIEEEKRQQTAAASGAVS